MNGVDDELLKPDLATADKSNSRKHGKPLKYGKSCGPRNILLSAKITCKRNCHLDYFSLFRVDKSYLCAGHFQNNNRTTFI